jgi:BTB/POZ domain
MRPRWLAIGGFRCRPPPRNAHKLALLNQTNRHSAMSEPKPSFWASLLAPLQSTPTGSSSAKSNAPTNGGKRTRHPTIDTDDKTVYHNCQEEDRPFWPLTGHSKWKKPRHETVPCAVPSTTLFPDHTSSAVARLDPDDDEIEPVVPQSLHWRNHPELSDWTVEVWTMNNEKQVVVERYPVHKSVLALESLYFITLFKEQAPTMTGRTSRFDFTYEAATAFPMLLDYMYASTSLELTTQNAAIFFYFGQVLGLPRLRWEAKQFWTLNLSLETVAMYYQQAVSLDNAKLLQAVALACEKPEILLHLTPESPLLNVPRADVWLHLVSTVGPRYSQHLSILVTKFCAFHFSSGIIDVKTFEQLFREDKLPVVDPSIVYVLLAIELQVRRVAENTRRAPHDQNINDLRMSIEERCLTAMEQSWETIDFASLDATWKHVDQSAGWGPWGDGKVLCLLRDRDPSFLLKIWQRTLTAAQKSCEVSHT